MELAAIGYEEIAEHGEDFSDGKLAFRALPIGRST